MKSVCLVVIVFLMMIIITGFSSSNVHSEPFSDAYRTFDRSITNFDPLGQALAPLNEIPRLKVSGLLDNTTLINMFPDKQVGYVNKNWRFEEIQWLAEIYTRFRLIPEAELVNSFQFLYDGVYDWQHSSLYADKVNKDSYISHRGDQIIRDFYLNIELGDWHLKLGKQQVVWGKMEGRWMDFINNLNSKDGLEVRSSLYNQLRIPLWMANVTYSFGESSLQFLWIPDFKPDLQPFPGSVWWSPWMPDPRKNPLFRGYAHDEPDPSFKNQQWALRFDTKLGQQTTWSLGYMYGFSPTATNFVERDAKGNMFFDPEYTRRHIVGTALDFGYLITGVPIIDKIPAAFRGEFVYQTDTYFNDPYKFNPLTGLLRDDGVSKTSFLNGAMQFHLWLPSQVWVYYQPMISRYFNWTKSLSVNQWSLGHLFFINKTWKYFDNRLNTTLYAILGTGGPLDRWDGTKIQLINVYYFSSNLEIDFSISDYRGGNKDLYGQYRKWGNVGWELKYAF